MKSEINKESLFIDMKPFIKQLQGATDTDYFYFFCPSCKNSQVMRILDYEIKEDNPSNPYNEQTKSKAARGFTISFDLFCEECSYKGKVKVSNLGFQTGKLSDSPALSE